MTQSNITITAGAEPSASVTVTLCGEHATDVAATRDATKVLLAVLDVSPEDVPLFKARIRDAVLGRLEGVPAQAPAPPPAGPRVTVAPNGEARIEGGEKVTGEHFACPDCGAEAKPSVDRYQEWETGDDGRQYAQKWFCPNGACKTKSLWRSKLRPMARS